MVQKIMQNGVELGFLPWGDGSRLGAARWTNLGWAEGQPSNQITLIATGVPEIDEIPRIFRNDTEYKLVQTTRERAFFGSQEIIWGLNKRNSQSILTGCQLKVLGKEGDEFHLYAMVDGIQAHEYHCFIEEKESIELNPLTIQVRFEGHAEVGICSLYPITEKRLDGNFEGKAMGIINIGGDRIISESGKISREHNSHKFGAYFKIPLVKCFSPENEQPYIEWITEHHIFKADVEFDYTLLGLEHIRPSVCLFKPQSLQYRAVLLSGYDDEIMTNINITMGGGKLNGWDVHLAVETPTKQVMGLVNGSNTTEPIKRATIKKWLQHSLAATTGNVSTSNIQCEISLTPCIDRKKINSLRETFSLNIEIEQSPQIGFQGESDELWTDFILREAGQLLTIAKTQSIQDPFNWMNMDLDPEKCQLLKRNHLFRSICRSNLKPPVDNCDVTKLLLANTFENEEKATEIIVRNHKNLMNHYSAHAPKRFDIDGLEIRTLFPRDSFTVLEDGYDFNLTDLSNGGSYLSNGCRLEIARSDGNKYVFTEEVSPDQKRQSFSYRLSSRKFFAPEEPGLYYLYLKDSNKNDCIIEIEVHGYLGGSE